MGEFGNYDDFWPYVRITFASSASSSFLLSFLLLLLLLLLLFFLLLLSRADIHGGSGNVSPGKAPSQGRRDFPASEFRAFRQIPASEVSGI